MGQEGIPDGFDPLVLMEYLDKRVENFCPSGIEKCECVQAPGLQKVTHGEKIASSNFQILAGTFTKGPIRFSDDILGSLVTLLGCNPGKNEFNMKCCSDSK